MAKPSKPGDRMEARCTRCKDVTGHVVIVFVDGSIAKVECLACGSIHKYHPPQGGGRPELVRKHAGEPRRALTPVAGAAKNSRAAENARAEWRAALERASGRPKAYGMETELSTGDVVEHTLFGMGCVRNVSRPDKAEILFEDGVRLLRCRC